MFRRVVDTHGYLKSRLFAVGLHGREEGFGKKSRGEGEI